jgi:hypothetical protein
MHIDSYSFGVMKVDGTEYRGDLIIFASRGAVAPDRVWPNWWRKEGHSLAVEDLGDVIDFKPEILVVGKGASGLMDVPASTIKTLREHGIKVVAENTSRACTIFNKQAESGKKVVGAFHLTC